MKTLVLFIHGAFSTKETWNYLAPKVEELGHETMFVEYDVAAEDADDIVGRALYLLSFKPFDKLWIVGHSYGGVLAVEIAASLGGKNVEVITLAAPLGGSELASLLSLLIPSKLVQNVGAYNQHMLWFKSLSLPCKVHSIVTQLKGSDNDGVVTVSSQLHFKNDVNFTSEILHASHGEVVLSSYVAGRLQQLLHGREIE